MDARVQGQPLGPLESRRGWWVLALLALRAGRPVEREWLAGTVWPESPPAQALYNLRSNLSRLRAALGGEAERLSTPSRRTISLDLTGAFADVACFEAALARGD